ncbi:ferredoxin Fer [Halorussus marinus]|uniref:ferredoxin Fer n=1 Tax=Halorussus marinus TaxID=2505976 RepID=UPI00106EC7BF|nr:ferredoxin Fer [Halorussus marinus]
MQSPFDVLRVDTDAEEAEIERAYRERVKEAHPDQGGSVEEFQAVRTAYERIKAGYVEDGRPPDSSPAPDPDPDPDPGAESEPPGDAPRGEPERAYSEVTYLNYDVLADFGWETDDEDLFEKAGDAGLDDDDYGRFAVEPGESLLEAAEADGYAWPFACRGGACANCAIKLVDGELSMPSSHVLPSDLMERGIRLSCNGMPITDELKVLFNVKHMPELGDLLLPPDPFEKAYPND